MNQKHELVTNKNMALRYLLWLVYAQLDKMVKTYHFIIDFLKTSFNRWLKQKKLFIMIFLLILKT